jgi:hypothetical protein
MKRLNALLIAAPVALGLLAAPAAQAEWRGHGGGGWDRGGWNRGGWEHREHRGNALAGALLGLGAAAVIGGIIASQPPPAYYPAPGYPPGYYPAPAYYPAPSYYPDPGYYPAQ